MATEWRKSSRSGGGGNACIELALDNERSCVRDTKARTAGTLHFAPAEFGTFVACVKSDTAPRGFSQLLG